MSNMTIKNKLKRKKKKVITGLLLFAAIQIVVNVLAKNYNVQITEFFATLNNYYFLDLISKIFFNTKNKLLLVSSFISVLACIFALSNTIKKAKTKKEKKYNEQIELWCACFIHLSACLVSYDFVFAVLMIALYVYSEYLNYKKKI